MDRRVRRPARMQEAAKPKTYSYSFGQTNYEHDACDDDDDDDDDDAKKRASALHAEFFCQNVYVLNNYHKQEQEQQQLVERFLSDDDYDHQHNYESIQGKQEASKSSEPSTDAIVSDSLADNQHNQHQQAMPPRQLAEVFANQDNSFSSSTSKMRLRVPTNSGLTNQYFMRCSTLNSSIRQRGSSRRRRRQAIASIGLSSPSSNVVRQVRFQPIPQTIDISIVETSDLTVDSNDTQITNIKSSSSIKMKKVHFSAKPLIKRLHNLSHIKFNRIKLKGFNSLKQQLNQTLNTRYARPPTAQPTSGKEQTLVNADVQNKSQKNQQDNDDDDWGSDFDEESLEEHVIKDVDQRVENKAEEKCEENVEEVEGEEDDEEEELQSLKARQGFRQIKDKLEVILDQRLADFERSASSGPQSVVCQLESSVPATTDQGSSLEEHATQASSELSGYDKPAGDKKVVVEVAEDWQSHCSDESGLESNHSGSQDSGHSTQHSGYSTHSCHLSHHQQHPPPLNRTNFEEQTQQHQTNRSPTEAPPALPEDTNLTRSHQPPVVESDGTILSGAPDPQQQVDEVSEQQIADLMMKDNRDRRSRFLQNRLIINSKLESIFQRTSTTALPAVLQPPVQRNLQTASCTDSITSDIEPSPYLISGSQGGTLDSTMRSKLLEQQRQMSLKLKQKPRRKSVKRLSSFKPQCKDVVVNQQVDNNNSSSYAANQLHDTSGRTRDTLTKQLSMICLRQAADQLKLQTHQDQLMSHGSLYVSEHHQSSGNLLPTVASTTVLIQRTCQPAMSLRQLVKNVIDDCEKPSQLSRLTKSILDRSSSLSSELGTSADELNSATTRNTDGNRCSQ